MPTWKLWPGAPGSKIEPPGPVSEKLTHEHPSVNLNGVTYEWSPGDEDGVPEEAVLIWKRFLEANA